MKGSRLSIALENGLFALPAEGRVAAFRPRAQDDLSPIGPDRAAVVQGFRPDHDAWRARGYSVTPEAEGEYAAAIVFLPRARAEARALIAEAAARLPAGAPIVVDGQKTDGIDAALRDCRTRMAVSEPLSKAHGKLFWAASPGPAALADWRAAPAELAGGFQTAPGIFSADAPDRASAALAAALPDRLPPVMADLGAGWGFLSLAVLRREGVRELHLIEAEHAALACARSNVRDPRAIFHWADVTAFRPDRPFDGIVMNPPFHTARAATPALGIAFIQAASAMLSPGGRLWMVANRHLPYERALSDCFRECHEIGGDGAFKIVLAAHPQRPARSRR